MADIRPSAKATLLQLLKRTPGLTAAELAKRLGVSSVAVRKHLDVLQRDGHVSVSLRRQSMGRPSYVYALTPAAATLFPQSYRPMLLEMLQELAQTEGEQKVKRLLDARAARQRARYEPQLTHLHADERVRALARLRNEEGFMTTLEEDESSFTLREFNCPIEDVSRQYHQACGCEIDLFRHLLGIKRVEQLETVLNGGHACTYKIPKRPDPEAGK